MGRFWSCTLYVNAVFTLLICSGLASRECETANHAAFAELAEQADFRANEVKPLKPSTLSSSLDKLTGNSTSISAADISAILTEISFTDIDRNGTHSATSNNSSKTRSTAVGCPMRALDTSASIESNDTDTRARQGSRPMLSTSRVNRPSPTTMEVAKASATIEAATVQMCQSALRASSSQTAAQVLRKLRHIDLTKIDNVDIRRAVMTFSRFNKRQKLGDDESIVSGVEAVPHKRPRQIGEEDVDDEELEFGDGEDIDEPLSVNATHHDVDAAERRMGGEHGGEHERGNRHDGPHGNHHGGPHVGRVRLPGFGGLGGRKPNTVTGQKPSSGSSGTPRPASTSTANRPVLDKKSCLTKPQFRTADGTRNNLLHTEWGRQNSLMKRLHGIGPHYEGDCKVKDPRMHNYAFDSSTYKNIFVDKPNFGKKKLPDARAVSNVLLNAGPNGIDDNTLTHMLMQWGQFLDHDLSLSPLYGALDGMSDLPLSESCVNDGKCLAHPECICICNTGDVGDKACLDLRRSAPGQTSLGEYREQINELTAYMDGSQVYGSSDNETLELRARFPTDLGLLKVSKANGQEMLPVEADVDAPGRSDGCQPKSAACFVAGDVRVNTHIGLASMQTLWLREHNRIARQLHTINPHWNGERIFQETRRLVGALLQRITYGHWLPIILGKTVMKTFGIAVRDDTSQYDCDSYKSGVEAATLNEFATAAFRFGHSLVENELRRRGKKTHIRLSDTYFDMSVLKNEPQTCNAILGGLSDQPAQKVDNLIAGVVRNELFKMDGISGQDLPARSIQRGRDHGQPGYAFFAWACQQRYGSLASTFYPNLRTTLNPTTEAYKIGQISLNELPLAPAAAKLLQQAGYAGFSAADMDLFPGGISEVPVRDVAQGGGLVGPTFACIIAEQFRQLKHGDRFFFTNPAVDGNGQANTECSGANAFTPCQLHAISRQSLAHVMCANGAVGIGQTIQRDVFRRVSTQTNPSMNCASLTALDLNLWKDGARCNEPISCQ